MLLLFVYGRRYARIPAALERFGLLATPPSAATLGAQGCIAPSQARTVLQPYETWAGCRGDPHGKAIRVGGAIEIAARESTRSPIHQ
jgi:hypothetical protein